MCVMLFVNTCESTRGGEMDCFIYSIILEERDVEKMKIRCKLDTIQKRACALFCTAVDLGGIEPPSLQCECSVLPLYYRPNTIQRHSDTLCRSAGRSNKLCSRTLKGPARQSFWKPSVSNARGLAAFRNGKLPFPDPFTFDSRHKCECLSECRESNPVLTNPNRKYYRYTTLRL